MGDGSPDTYQADRDQARRLAGRDPENRDGSKENEDPSSSKDPCSHQHDVPTWAGTAQEAAHRV
jgi:hypothetical protein